MSGDIGALIATAAAGRPLQEIAEAAGVSVSTVQRRLKDPAVQAEIRQLQAQQRRAAHARLVGLREAALNRVERLIDEAWDDGTKLRAAALVLRLAERSDEILALDERLSTVELVLAAPGEPESAAGEAAGEPGGPAGPAGPRETWSFWEPVSAKLAAQAQMAVGAEVARTRPTAGKVTNLRRPQPKRIR